MSVYFNIFSLCSLMFLLSACSTPTHRPSDDLCTGTKKPYQIKGVWYHPQDHYDYDEEGVASWYGPGFHQRPKSCGGMFDMHELSAAHKTLPIPSVVEVTNMENGKSLKLVVDDRGPFVDDRIIDLSKKAAMELGTHNKGLAKVRVTTLPDESKALADFLKQYGRYGRVSDGRSWADVYYEEIADKNYTPPKIKNSAFQHKDVPKKPSIQPIAYHQDDRGKLDAEIAKILQPSSKAPLPSSKKTHYIQVGSFIKKDNAEKLKSDLSYLGKTNLAETTYRDGQRFFTVKLGPFFTQDQAQKMMEKLFNKGHHGASLITQ